jgi:signal transduction histidine kinase/CheY-like chemotaxis protein
MAVFGLIMLLFLAVRTLARQLLRPLQAIDALSADLADERPVSAERFEPLHESRAVEIRSLAGRLSRMDLAVRERRANDVARANESEERFQDAYRQLLQSQKMEGLGQLAGGVAHDFNNMLAGILGSAELLGIELPPESDAHAHVGVILNSGRRAAALTRQLLTFARAQRTTAERLNVHDVLQNALDLVSRTFDRRIEVRQLLHAQRTTVFGDATLLQNVLMNLAVNARDAMPEGGTLTITTRDATIDEEFSRQHSFPVAPGEFVEITVSDTGHGMSPEVRDRIFEPFYTTKPVGRGTGLGLAVVYGTVRDHHGAIAVCSEPGVGTEFRLYLPVDAGIVDVTAASQTAVPGSGCVLVVDDEPLLRQTARRVLESLGYDVLLATDGEHALQVFRAERARIDLVLLDLVMPKMDGQATFHALRTLSPGLRIVLCSGFSADSSWTSLLAYPNVAFVEKPYQRAELSIALAAVAGGVEASSAS